MLKRLDSFLNTITMYKLTRYCLAILWCVGFFLSFFHLIPFTSFDFVVSLMVIFVICWLTNAFFAFIFKAPANIESTYITILILSLIAGPEPLDRLWFLAVTSIVAIASKYIIAVYKRHIFNPAAFGVAFSAFFLNYYPSWWIG